MDTGVFWLYISIGKICDGNNLSKKENSELIPIGASSRDFPYNSLILMLLAGMSFYSPGCPMP
ncbi:hypothetical protein CDQ84_13040 [Clostridium thermosuccinogenes]|jgi:hypothetical protein|uniref:Uncharacterized protein n=1 Tax=Clostridium thermosuccinogenes TaxID=84032 RepID=A0A2K2FC39_9CLOT|nr:hypothetical protein [Pseudoclostridium thermosuccinogenes]AUS96676.1 hypothetical protein CDO33_09635 [Pseudoclostridium thermosuccinogenes]PNT92664.1 hypothetical protein CDQ83_03620 [Pseudoclostridium thermosuccinogenes]PNT96338.1 hypothetical protein CDQ85_12055 [Pseudoclostridium thermosuccinogenes]PNT97503.1 hypothetical protein CDQ84_13040 [Pseudoclostridium thermosuccinogenes]